MKILIGYDGSEASKDALNDLRRAGLPASADVRLLAVADVFLPPADSDSAAERYTGPVPAGIRPALRRAAAALESARLTAAEGVRQVQSMFPQWVLRSDGVADSPAWALVRESDTWHPDLIVVGAEGESSWGGRLILGSVAQRVLYEAHGSVRIARGSRADPAAPVRILLGYDGSPGSRLAVEKVVTRNWPSGTEVRVVMVLDGSIFASTIADEPEGFKGLAPEEAAELELAELAAAAAVQRLQAAGLTASAHFFSGRPKQVLVDEAAAWGATAIFLGAQGVRGWERFVLGSVAAAVASRASCSVEIVRS